MLTTTMFEDLTARVATTFGMPDARRVVVGHPLGGTAEQTLLEWADDAVERLIAEFSS